MKTQQAVLGIDFGGVINDGSSHPSGDDTSFLSGGFETAMETPAMAGAFEAIRRLNVVFDGQIWIVSKCGPHIQERTEQWLSDRDFFNITGVHPGHVRFCRARSEKAVHCAELQVTHFVDDRSDVLGHLSGVVDHLYLFGSRARGEDPCFKRVATWSDAEREILISMASGSVRQSSPSM